MDVVSIAIDINSLLALIYTFNVPIIQQIFVLHMNIINTNVGYRYQLSNT